MQVKLKLEKIADDAAFIRIQHRVLRQALKADGDIEITISKPKNIPKQLSYVVAVVGAHEMGFLGDPKYVAFLDKFIVALKTKLPTLNKLIVWQPHRPHWVTREWNYRHPMLNTIFMYVGFAAFVKGMLSQLRVLPTWSLANDRMLYMVGKSADRPSRTILLKRVLDSEWHKKRLTYTLLNGAYGNTSPDFPISEYTSMTDDFSTEEEVLQFIADNEHHVEDYEQWNFGNPEHIFSHRTLSAAPMDIIHETGPSGCFITEKTYRSLALGRPFVQFNPTLIYRELEFLGYKRYTTYDITLKTSEKLDPNSETFDSCLAEAKELKEGLNDPVQRERIRLIAKHNQRVFQRQAQRELDTIRTLVPAWAHLTDYEIITTYFLDGHCI